MSKDNEEDFPVPIYAAVIEDMGPAVAYGGPPIDDTPMSERFPGKIKEHNIKHNRMAYKDTLFVASLRKMGLDERTICNILSALEEWKKG